MRRPRLGLQARDGEGSESTRSVGIEENGNGRSEVTTLNSKDGEFIRPPAGCYPPAENTTVPESWRTKYEVRNGLEGVRRRDKGRG